MAPETQACSPGTGYYNGTHWNRSQDGAPHRGSCISTCPFTHGLHANLVLIDTTNKPPRPAVGGLPAQRPHHTQPNYHHPIPTRNTLRLYDTLETSVSQTGEYWKLVDSTSWYAPGHLDAISRIACHASSRLRDSLGNEPRTLALPRQTAVFRMLGLISCDTSTSCRWYFRTLALNLTRQGFKYRETPSCPNERPYAPVLA